MELTNIEISCIGTFDDVLGKETNLRRIAKSSTNYFDACNYKFNIKNGYKRYVSYKDTIERYVETDEITKLRDGVGFFPTYMCREGNFTFTYGSGSGIEYDAENLRKDLGEYLEVIWETKTTLKVKIKDESKYLIEFNFLPHNLGPYIKIITRI